MWPTCGLSWTVMPHTYIPTRPGVTGTNSRFSRVSVSKMRKGTGSLLGAAGDRHVVAGGGWTGQNDVSARRHPNADLVESPVDAALHLARRFGSVGPGARADDHADLRLLTAQR